MIFKNQKEFDSNFRKYYQLLVSFANKQIKDLETSQDLVQDVFISLYERQQQEQVVSLKSYLYKSVFNRCKSHQRKLIVQKKHLESIDPADLIEFNKNVEATELEFRVHQAINKLAPRCKEVFLLSRFEDLSNAEIADRLQISKRTVETQISKALKSLRSALSPSDFFLFFSF